jgi:hypothetical protein
MSCGTATAPANAGSKHRTSCCPVASEECRADVSALVTSWLCIALQIVQGSVSDSTRDAHLARKCFFFEEVDMMHYDTMT